MTAQQKSFLKVRKVTSYSIGTETGGGGWTVFVEGWR